MKPLKNFMLATMAGMCLGAFAPSLSAQSVCEWIGDGLNGRRFQQITELIPCESDLAFLGWNGSNDDDMETFVGRVSSSGSLVWSKSLNLIAPQAERANAILRTQNGNLITASNGANVFSLAKLDGATGTVLTSRFYPHGFEIVELFEQPNGNIVAFATRNANSEVSAMMLDANLNFINGVNTGVTCILKKVIRNNNGSGFFGVGIKAVGVNDIAGVVFKLNNNLSHAWTRNIATGNGDHFLNTIGQFNAGALVVAGHDGDCVEGTGRMVMHGFSDLGVYLGTRVVREETECLESRDLRILSNGDVFVTGRRGDFFPFEITTVTLDNAGTLLGATRNGPGTGNCIAVSNADQAFIGGHSINMNGLDEGYFSGLDPQRTSCCSESLVCSLTTPVLNPTSPNPIPQTSFVLNSSLNLDSKDFGVVTLFCSDPAPRMANPAKRPVASIFPNPASTEFSITISDEAAMQVYDLKGQVQLEQRLETGTHTIPVDYLENGLYLVRITSVSGISTHRLAIAR